MQWDLPHSLCLAEWSSGEIKVWEWQESARAGMVQSPGCSSSPALPELRAVLAAHPHTRDSLHDSARDELEKECHHFDPVKNNLSAAFSLCCLVIPPSPRLFFFFCFCFFLFLLKRTISIRFGR